MLLNNIQQINNTPGNKQSLDGLIGSEKILAIKAIYQRDTPVITIICPDNQTAQQYYQSLHFLLPDEKVFYFPDWETLPYDMLSPHQDIISTRLNILQRLPSLKKAMLITSVNASMQRLSNKAFLDGFSFQLQTGEALALTQTSEKLIHAGYRRVEQVMEHGEFCIRGALLDLFPMGADEPYRIELFDDEIETIRRFDPDTQRSVEKVKRLDLLPAKEFPFTNEAIRLFRQQWRETFDGNPANCPIYEDISSGKLAAGVEYYLPLFFENTATLFDYLPKKSLVFHIDDTKTACDEFWQTIIHRHDELSHDITHPILEPKSLFLNKTELLTQCKQFSQLLLTKTTDIRCSPIENNEIDSKSRKNYQIDRGPGSYADKKLPNISIDHQKNDPLYLLKQFSKAHENILICANSSGRKEILHQLFNEYQFKHEQLDHFPEKEIKGALLCASPLQQGFTNADFALITENDLFGETELPTKRSGKSTEINQDNMIRNLVELSIGDAVVHLEHGVGRYRGLESIEDNGQSDEYLMLEYAEKNKLYVPVSSLHLISRYSGHDAKHAPLHQLGTDQWDKIKKKAAKKIHDVAAELLQLYAKRASETAFACEPPEEEYEQFAREFPFTETVDQQRAIDQTLEDMCSNKMMDRLICGDVGFGKTEVSMRAAFLAVQNGKQAAMLVPTTLLAQQHYDNFCDRFAKWPISIEVLSRFRSAKQQKLTLEKLQQGKVDILIGTHRLLQKDIIFKDLGLMIIDEEHRFGVKHKEALKKMRSNIDTLTLTATPIPRTLNLSLSNIRDLSLIATAPAKRLAIKTFVQERKDHIIREAATREIMRGGQVYFLHNNVQTIEKTAEELEKLIPQARVAVAHGQMRERQLENIMNDFHHRQTNLLVCTTIVESGIDIPSANTIIIDRADKLGLAQLHQLRGRVGRSHHQAYAYLLTPGKKAMTSDAKKRLEAISALEDLGIGFTLATHDLEIRGAGELLGKEQSGRIEEIGFTLYMELLERTVQDLKAGKKTNVLIELPESTVINLNRSAVIPKTYLPDVHTRLVLYKRIASCQTKTKLADLTAEIIDRFGPLPEETFNLLTVTELKLLAEPLKIQTIDITKTMAKIDFSPEAPVDPQKIISLLKHHKDFKMERGHILKCPLEKDSSVKQRAELLKRVLTSLSTRGG